MLILKGCCELANKVIRNVCREFLKFSCRNNILLRNSNRANNLSLRARNIQSDIHRFCEASAVAGVTKGICTSHVKDLLFTERIEISCEFY